MDSIITQVTKDQITQQHHQQQTEAYQDHHHVDQSSKQNSLLRQRRIVSDKSSSSSTSSSSNNKEPTTDHRGSSSAVAGGNAPPQERNSASNFLRKLLNSCCCCVRKQSGRSKNGDGENGGKVCGETRGGGRDAWDSTGGDTRNVDLFVGGGGAPGGLGLGSGSSSSSAAGSNDEIDSVSAGVCSVVVSGERGSGDNSRGSSGIGPNSSGSAGFLLPACLPQDRSRPCMVIDLDETLVHSSFKPISNADFIVPVEIDGVVHQVYVAKRPYVDEFLQKMGELYECVLFTASLAKYADPVADLLDKWGVFRTRLFRDACVFHRGNYVKDLNKLGRSLHRVVIVDNSPASYIFHPDNAVPVASWFDDSSDTELLYLIPFFERLSSVDNVYTVLRNSNHPYNCINKDTTTTQSSSPTSSNPPQSPQSVQQPYSIIHSISPQHSASAAQQQSPQHHVIHQQQQHNLHSNNNQHHQQSSSVQSYDVTSTSSESHEIIYSVSNNYTNPRGSDS